MNLSVLQSILCSVEGVRAEGGPDGGGRNMVCRPVACKHSCSSHLARVSEARYRRCFNGHWGAGSSEGTRPMDTSGNTLCLVQPLRGTAAGASLQELEPPLRDLQSPQHRIPRLRGLVSFAATKGVNKEGSYIYTPRLPLLSKAHHTQAVPPSPSPTLFIHPRTQP